MAISDLDYTDDSDIALIRRTRMGDTDAYGLLHRRHVGSARALAWRMSRSASDADDLVSEGFARVLAALQRGGGPDTAFRPYLLSTIRRLAYDRTDRERRESPVEHEVEEGSIGDDPVLADFERETAAAAFASLPERWRMVLWHTEVEGESPAEVAAMLGMKPNAVAALAYRAREGLRQAYLSHHAGVEHAGSRECRHTADRLAAYVRGGLSPAQEQRVAGHLDECDRCQGAYLELATVNTSMRSLLAPIVLGPVAGAAYLAELANPTAVAPAGAGTAGRAAARGVRRLVGTPARSAVAAGVVAVVAVSVGLLAARGAPAQEVAAGPSPASVGGPAVAGVSRASAPDRGPEPNVQTAGASEPTTTSTAPTATSTATSTWPDVAVREPGRSASASAAVSAAPPAAPTVTAPDPASTAPADITSHVAAPPVVSTSTTAPPVTTTTTTVAPPPPSKLQVSLSSAGQVVAGRPGVLVAAVSNSGAGDGHAVRLRLDLEGVALRGLPRPSAVPGTPASPAWSCTSEGPATLACTTDAVGAGVVSSLYVPVAAPADAHRAEVSGSVTGSADAADAGATTVLDLAVRPTGMAARFAAVERGDVVAVGNTLVSCPEASPGCVEARQGLGTSLDNGSHVMEAVDTDADPTTANSSSAVSTCPGGDSVLSATLYWGADLSPGPGGQPPADPSAVGRAVVVAPGGGRAEVVAERVDVLGTRYQGVADVTALAAGAGAGSWTVGGVALATGEGTYGGWSLVVACADASAPRRSLVVLDGLTEVRADATVALEVGGFSVPAAGSGAASVTTVTYEGDLGLQGDQLSVGGRAVADACNLLGNTFNSTASRLGQPAVGSVPGDRNLFGLDVDRFDLAGALPAGATSTVLELSTAEDVYLPGVVAFAVDQ